MEVSNSSNLLMIGSVDIDLNAYSNSPGFCGYLECPREVTTGSIADEVVRQSSGFGPCSVLVSLAHIDEGEAISPQAKLFLNKLVEVGWVKLFSTEEWDAKAKADSADPKSDIFREKVLSQNFRVFDFALADEKLAQNFAFVLALVSWHFVLVGHVFIYWESKGLVVYPHENVGIGCICVPENINDGKAFLKSFKWKKVESPLL